MKESASGSGPVPEWQGSFARLAAPDLASYPFPSTSATYAVIRSPVPFSQTPPSTQPSPSPQIPPLASPQRNIDRLSSLMSELPDSSSVPISNGLTRGKKRVLDVDDSEGLCNPSKRLCAPDHSHYYLLRGVPGPGSRQPRTAVPLREYRRGLSSTMIMTCIWGSSRGQVCGMSGQAMDVWVHIKRDHGLKHQEHPKPPPCPTSCGWSGCEFEGGPEDLLMHWKTSHKKGLVSQAKPATGGCADMNMIFRCQICPPRPGEEATQSSPEFFKLSEMVKHVDQKHFKTERHTRWCEVCGEHIPKFQFHGKENHTVCCIQRLMLHNPYFEK